MLSIVDPTSKDIIAILVGEKSTESDETMEQDAPSQ
jgi:hypothetical protein